MMLLLTILAIISIIVCVKVWAEAIVLKIIIRDNKSYRDRERENFHRLHNMLDKEEQEGEFC